MKISKEQVEVIKKIADKHGFTVREMTYILHYPFRYTIRVIKEGNNDKVLLNGLGKFYVHPMRIQIIKEKLKNSNNIFYDYKSKQLVSR